MTQTMRIPLGALALLLALPSAAALSAEASLGGDVQASLPLATPDTPGPVRLDDVLAALPAPEGALDDVLELASVGAQARASAGGEDGVEAGAGVGRSEGRFDEVAKAVVPAVERNAPAAVATVGLLGVLQAIGAWRFVGLGAVGLYSRLTKSDLLDNAHRDAVYKLIQENPGLGVSEIAAKSGLGWGTTVYHLDRLERAGFVASERGGIHKCFFPVGTVAREARKGIGALKQDTTRSVAAYLLAKPGATQSELCDALGLSASAASKQVTKLEAAGLVRRERDWKTVHLYPQETLPDLLGPAPTAAPAPAAPFSTPLAA